MSKIDCGALAHLGKDGIEYRGQVQLGARLDGTLTLRRHPRAGSSNEHPDYTVEYAHRDGAPHVVGAAWIKNGQRVGDFISMTLDDPDWTSPLNLTAFPPSRERGETSWPVVWSRPRGARVQDAAHPEQAQA